MSVAGLRTAPRRIPLTGQEKQLFDEMISDEPRYLDIAIPHLHDRVIALLQFTIEAAKAQQGNAPFGGAYPEGGQLGVGDLRPYHIGGSITWNINYTATGWQNWVLNAVTTLRDHWILVWELENLNPVTKTTDLQLIIGGRTFPVLDLRKLDGTLNRRESLPDPILIPPLTNIGNTQARVKTVGNDELKFIGATVTTGTNLIKQQPT